MLREDIIDAIGRTPLVRLRLKGSARAPVFAKMELMNPLGMKDRVAKRVEILVGLVPVSRIRALETAL